MYDSKTKNLDNRKEEMRDDNGSHLFMCMNNKCRRTDERDGRMRDEELTIVCDCV